MFSINAHKKQHELDVLFKFLELLYETEGVCKVKRSVLVKNNIDISIIKLSFNRLKIDIDESDPNMFRVLSSQDQLAKELNEVYGLFSKPSSTQQASDVTIQPSAPDMTMSMADDLIDSIDTQCQHIISSCVANSSSASSQPLYDEAQLSLLTHYVRAAINALDQKRPDEAKSQYDSRIRAFNARVNQLKNQFMQQFSAQVACDNMNQPLIFALIHQELQQIAKQNKLRSIQSVFSYSSEDLNALDVSLFQQLYMKSVQTLQIVDATQNVLNYLCERGGQPRDLVRLTMQSTQTTAFTQTGNDPLAGLVFTLTVPNEAFGYSIHNMLVIAEIIPNTPFVGNPNRDYAQPMSFQLTHAELKVLQSYLADLSKWYRDFENILASLFDSDAELYITTGRKPLHEAVKTEIVREAHGHPLFMNQDVRERFQQHATEPFLLFGQAALDLTNHPQREAMRDLFEWLYARCGLQDSKLEAKTFVLNESNEKTFVSLLSIGHIRQIYDEIMALATLTRSAKEMGFTLYYYINLLGSGDAKGLYHTYLQLLLVDLMMNSSVTEARDTVVSKRRKMESRANSALPAPTAAESLNDLQVRFHKAVESLLNKSMDIQLNRAVIRADRMPTDAEKRALLTNDRSSTSVPFAITSNAQVDYTLQQLKASAHYATLANAYADYYQSLGARPILSTGVDPQYIYMHPTLDECLNNLTNQLKSRSASDELTHAKQAWLQTVMKIVHANTMQIPHAALKRASERFADVFKIDNGRDDAGSGCTTGFAGRCLMIESQLVSGDDNDFMQFNRQLLINEVEQSFNDTAGSIQAGESSMAARIKPQVMDYVGLTPDTTGRSYHSYMGNVNQVLAELACRYTPGKVYRECYEYMCDEFKRCIRDNDHDGMEGLLTSLGYSPEVDGPRFMVDGKWNIKYFEMSLPEKLITVLTVRGIFVPGQGRLNVAANQTSYSFEEVLRQKQQRLDASIAAARRHTMFAQNATAANQGQSNITPTAPSWGNGGLYQSAASRRAPTQSTSVDLRGDSSMSTNPGTGSTG